MVTKYGRRDGHDVDDWLSASTMVEGSLKDASLGRLVCLLRHWTWADEAMARFDRELADGWDHDDDPMSDHPFGAFYHWCALLCGFADAALDHGLLSASELGPIRQDIEASLPRLRRAHQAFGEALRREQVSREIDSLDH
jgi:hypothetical protein